MLKMHCGAPHVHVKEHDLSIYISYIQYIHTLAGQQFFEFTQNSEKKPSKWQFC